MQSADPTCGLHGSDLHSSKPKRGWVRAPRGNEGPDSPQERCGEQSFSL